MAGGEEGGNGAVAGSKNRTLRRVNRNAFSHHFGRESLVRYLTQGDYFAADRCIELPDAVRRIDRHIFAFDTGWDIFFLFGKKKKENQNDSDSYQ